MKEIDQILNNLPDDCGIVLSPIQRRQLRKVIANYALSCLLDSKLAEETEEVCQDYDEQHD